jgi:carbonic anhydrase
VQSKQILHAVLLRPRAAAAGMLAALRDGTGTACAQQPNHLADPAVFASDNGVLDMVATRQQIPTVTYVPQAIAGFHLAAVFALLWLTLPGAAPAAGQAAQLPDRPSDHIHAGEINFPSGVTDKCEPAYTYEEGPRGPSNWVGVCNTGPMQTPIDITNPEKVSIELLPLLGFNYQPTDLDVVNDCNHYQIKLRFPKNQWFRVGKRSWRLSEVRFRTPGETAVNGKRPPMSLQLVHLSPEAAILIVEVPVVAGEENPVIKTLWDRIPYPGKEIVTPFVKINVANLLPADRGFYRFPGSLTAPICNEGVQWFVLKNPIEMSEDQINQYRKYYHDTARPLQPVNNRPLVDSQ